MKPEINKKLLPKLKVTDEFDLITLDTNITIKHLEEQIKLREAAVEDKLKTLLKKPVL